MQCGSGRCLNTSFQSHWVVFCEHAVCCTASAALQTEKPVVDGCVDRYTLLIKIVMWL